MNKIIYCLLFLLSLNLYSYRFNHGGDGMCDEYANYQIDKSSFPAYWQPMIVEIVKNAVNWWNEAGSEHHLYYDGIGGSNPEIDYADFCYDDAVACAATVSNGICIVTSWSTITVDSDYWMDDDFKGSFKLQTILAHEFGHLLGLDHTRNGLSIYSSYTEDYRTILMRSPSYNYGAHLTEDDKKGVRDIYGKDDQNLRSSSSSKTTYYPNNGKVYFTTGNTDYQSYSKPELVFQPDRSLGYDYIMVWNKSNTREINYKFVRDCGSNNNELCSISKYDRHYIDQNADGTYGGSQSLTSPSIVISDNGENALIVWRQEYADKVQNKADDIYYAKIPTNPDPDDSQRIKSHIVYDNVSCPGITGNCSDTDYDHYKAKTTTKPNVVWIEKWQRFVIFYAKLATNYHDSWRITYIVSDDATGTFATDPTEYSLSTLRTNWNPMAIECNQTYNTNKKACLLVFNEINLNEYQSVAENIAKTTFKILEPSLTIGVFDIKEINKSGNWDRWGYGHYSLASRPYPQPTYTGTLNVLNRITKSAKQVANNLKFILYRTTSGYWNGIAMDEYSSSTSYYSRTGYSMTYNSEKEIFKYLWIRE